MNPRVLAAAAGMTMLTIAGLVLTLALMLFAASTLPWWCAWIPLAGWAVGLVLLVRLMWQEWRDVWRP